MRFRLTEFWRRTGIVLMSVSLLLPLSILASPEPDNPVIDQPGLFKMRRIESLQEKGFRYQIHQYWRTDNELLLSASQYKDWKAPGAWDDRVFRWDIETGAITDTPYVGSLTCASKDRLVLRQDVPDTSGTTKRKTRMVLSGAVFGQPAIPFEPSVYNPYSCEPMERRIAGDFGPNTSLLPLLPGHGRLLEQTKPRERTMWFLPEGKEERIQIGAGTKGSFGEETYYYPLGQGHPAYLPWRDQYLLVGATGDHSIERMWTYDLTLYFLSPTGQIEPQREPLWINASQKANRLVVSFVATQAGVVWYVHGAFRGTSTPFDGLYLERHGQLIRFLRHAALSQAYVSPGGCRALVAIDPARQNFQLGSPTELHLINFCEESTL